MSEISLLDILSQEMIQNIRDLFVKMNHITLTVWDESGNILSDNSGNVSPNESVFGDCCRDYIRSDEIAFNRCRQCNHTAMLKTMQTGKISSYVCHAGFHLYAAPIILDEQIIGGFSIGQILYEKPDEECIRTFADEYQLDFEELFRAMSTIPVRKREEVENIAEFVSSLAAIVSNQAASRAGSLESIKELSQVAEMKSDFLANMSHEIRTPMNAVIGMAEMALREDLSDEAREYIMQIKNAGRILLYIINDILDYSKIESGNVEIRPEEYEPRMLLMDVTNIIMSRLVDKDVEFLLRMNPSLPSKLFGDSQRLRQILINLANNAVKFTYKGHVAIDVDFEMTKEDEADIIISVSDTGIGIAKEDIPKIFQSFRQVDSKRNRSIEGTGLGLPITKNLIELMGGKIGVESEYGRGSRFYFRVPQKILDSSPTLMIEDAEKIFVIGYIHSRILARQFYRDCNELGIQACALIDHTAFDEFLEQHKESMMDKQIFLYVENHFYDDEIQKIIEHNPKIFCIRLDDYGTNAKPDRQQLFISKKPYSTISLASSLKREKMNMHKFEDGNVECDFIAPDAEVLIVDDNVMNLAVAEGLLKPLKMKIFTASSGKQALSQIQMKKFDLIFMDHMMPQLDGVETTRIIRRDYPDYKDVPIIALAATGVEGAREMYIAEGMNDFVAKPIDVSVLVSKVKQWLPKDKIKSSTQEEMEEVDNRMDSQKLVIADLDTETAIKMLGSQKLYMKVLNGYYKAIDKQYNRLKSLEESGDLANYTIEVHSLKSLSKQIGAFELAKMAEELEKAGREQKSSFIRKNNGKMLKKYLSYKEVFKPLFPDEEKKTVTKPSAEKDRLAQIFVRMNEAKDNLDMDGMEEALNDLNKYSYPPQEEELLRNLSEAVSVLDVDEVEIVVKQWEILLQI